jgi:hypothetical protein
MMADLTNPDKKAIVKNSALAGIGGGALMIFAMQWIAFNAFMDMISGVGLISLGYAICWIRKR